MANYIDNTIKNIGRLFDGSPNMKDKYESGYTNRAAYWQGKSASGGLDIKDPKVAQRIAGLKSSIAYNMVEQVESSMKSILPSGYPLDLIGSATLSADKQSFCITTRVHGAEKDGAFNFDTRLNLSVDMLLEMGPIELQAVVTSMVYASIMNSSKLEGDTLESLRDGESLTKEKQEKSEYVNGVESFISDYIVALLKSKKPFESNGYVGKSDSIDYKPIAKIVSSSIVAQVKESAGEGCSLDEAAHMAINGMFDRSILENANIATEEEYESTLIHSHETRKEQLAHLVSMSGSDKEGFCRTFIQSYLESYDIPKNALQVTFDSSGSELGMFYPTNPPRININLENVKDTTDLCMTMVHEISHFKDNKSGIKSRTSYGSRTEINSCGLDENSEEFKLMNKLQKLCYYLDEDEKRARLSEIEALDIMEEVSKSDSSLVYEVDLNRKRHNAYLSKTNNLERDIVSGKIDLGLLSDEINASNVSDDVKAIMEKKLRFLKQRRMEINKQREENAKSSESLEDQKQPGE